MPPRTFHSCAPHTEPWMYFSPSREENRGNPGWQALTTLRFLEGGTGRLEQSVEGIITPPRKTRINDTIVPNGSAFLPPTGRVVSNYAGSWTHNTTVDRCRNLSWRRMFITLANHQQVMTTFFFLPSVVHATSCTCLSFPFFFFFFFLFWFVSNDGC